MNDYPRNMPSMQGRASYSNYPSENWNEGATTEGATNGYSNMRYSDPHSMAAQSQPTQFPPPSQQNSQFAQQPPPQQQLRPNSQFTQQQTQQFQPPQQNNQFQQQQNNLFQPPPQQTQQQFSPQVNGSQMQPQHMRQSSQFPQQAGQYSPQQPPQHQFQPPQQQQQQFQPPQPSSYQQTQQFQPPPMQQQQQNRFQPPPQQQQATQFQPPPAQQQLNQFQPSPQNSPFPSPQQSQHTPQYNSQTSSPQPSAFRPQPMLGQSQLNQQRGYTYRPPNPNMNVSTQQKSASFGVSSNVNNNGNINMNMRDFQSNGEMNSPPTNLRYGYATGSMSSESQPFSQPSFSSEPVSTPQIQTNTVSPKVAATVSDSSDDSPTLTELKVVVVGLGGVGKSALTISFVQNYFVDIYDPTIEDSYRKQISVDGKPCLLHILDTAGQEEYSAMRDLYMRKGEGFIIVCSMTDRFSLIEVPRFRNEALQAKDAVTIPIVVAANKCDLKEEFQVTRQEVDDLVKMKIDCPLLFVSAKDRTNVDELFHSIVRLVRLENKATVTKTSKRKTCRIL